MKGQINRAKLFCFSWFVQLFFWSNSNIFLCNSLAKLLVLNRSTQQEGQTDARGVVEQFFIFFCGNLMRPCSAEFYLTLGDRQTNSGKSTKVAKFFVAFLYLQIFLKCTSNFFKSQSNHPRVTQNCITLSVRLVHGMIWD